MPKLYEYFGLIIFFYANEHWPVHVHCRFQEYEMRAEFIIENGNIAEIRIKGVRGRKPLPQPQLSDFEKVLIQYADEIVQKWIDFFVLGKKITFTKIKRKIK